jgi:RND family efflux transporter MFP subunit
VAVAAYPEERFPGRLDFIGRRVEEETRTTRARIVVPNRSHRLLPGMFASVELAVGEGRPVLAVPREAVQRDGEQAICFVEEEPGHYERREVVVGEAGPTYVEVRSGLAEGERVVTTGAFILKSEIEKEGMGGGHHH